MNESPVYSPYGLAWLGGFLLALAFLVPAADAFYVGMWLSRSLELPASYVVLAGLAFVLPRLCCMRGREGRGFAALVAFIMACILFVQALGGFGPVEDNCGLPGMPSGEVHRWLHMVLGTVLLVLTVVSLFRKSPVQEK